MRRSTLIILVLFFFCPPLVQGQSGWKTVKTETYTIKVPSEWIYTPLEGDSFSLMDKERSPTFYIGLEILPNDRLTIEGYESDISDELDHIASQTKSNMKHENVEFRRVFSTGTMDHPAEKLRIDERFTVYKEHFIIFSASYPDDSKAEDFEKTIRQIFQSFHLK